MVFYIDVFEISLHIYSLAQDTPLGLFKKYDSVTNWNKCMFGRQSDGMGWLYTGFWTVLISVPSTRKCLPTADQRWWLLSEYCVGRTCLKRLPNCHPPSLNSRNVLEDYKNHQGIPKFSYCDRLTVSTSCICNTNPHRHMSCNDSRPLCDDSKTCVSNDYKLLLIRVTFTGFGLEFIAS